MVTLLDQLTIIAEFNSQSFFFVSLVGKEGFPSENCCLNLTMPSLTPLCAETQSPTQSKITRVIYRVNKWSNRGN